MAASGYTPIILFNSTTASNVPTTSNLAVGELAINIPDGKLYYNKSGTITVLANANFATSVSTISFGTTGLTPSTATNGVVTVAGTLAVANGGTGQTTASAGFNALSPITTTGDLIIGNGTNSATRLAIGANTYVLTSNGTTASWVAPSGGGSAATPTALGTVYGATPASSNVALGYNSGTGGGYNTFVGNTAGQNTTGSYNSAYGQAALVGASPFTANRNDAFGYASLNVITSGSYNSCYGFLTGQALTSGSYNVAVGPIALQYATTASYNTAVGFQAGNNNTTGTRITAIGAGSLYNNTATDNTAVGYSSLNSNTTGQYNVAVGCQESSGYPALYSNTTASANTAMGAGALSRATTGGANTGLGYKAGFAITTGVQNTFIGQNAGVALTTGNNNIAIGGVGTFTSATSDTNTIVIGAYSGGNLNGGYENTLIGYNVSASSATVDYELVLASGSGATGKGANTGYISPSGGGVYQGNNSAAWSVTSDQRLKKNIVDNNVGLDKVIQIQVRNFEYRTEDEVTDLPKNQAIKKQGIQLGVIAQELQQVLPDCVKQESTGVLAVDSTDIMYHMINAIKELNAKITALEAKLGA